MSFAHYSGSLIAVAVSLIACPALADDSLETRLREMDPAVIVAQAQSRGDAKAGALVFHRSVAACVKCHGAGTDSSPLGPDLASIDRSMTGVQIVESILFPSRVIRKGFETVSVLTIDGEIITGMLARDEPDQLVLRDATNLEREIVVDKRDIDQQSPNAQSMMPAGLAATLRDERQFFDLVKYILEIAQGGPLRARQLQPLPKDLLLVDDIKDLDHEGILRALGPSDFDAGKEIYMGHCRNCHGVDGNTPTLPMARAFGTQKLRFGADPYQMLLTLSRGNGLMTPMQHLSPKERYQVIHFIREAFMKASNPDFVELDDAYLASIPKGTATGELIMLGERDFGPVLGSQLGNSVNNALTFRLADDITASYDLHRMKIHEVWRNGFLDLSQTHHYRGRGEQMPQIDGEPIPGLGTWQWAYNDSFEMPDDAKPPRGPVNADRMRYFGHYLFADQAVLSYAIEDRKILETIESETTNDLISLRHTLRIEASDRALTLCVGALESPVSPQGVMPIGGTAVTATSGNAADSLAVVSTRDLNAFVAAAVDGDIDALAWKVDGDGRIVLTIPASTRPRVFRVLRAAGKGDRSLQDFHELAKHVAADTTLVDPRVMTQGGPLRWPQLLTDQGELGEPVNGYALDTISVPFDNPWNAWMRTSSLDFFDDGRAVVTTHGGDVYIVSGIDDDLKAVTWKRFVAGLFEPFGVRVVDDTIYVTCRDGIQRLHDYNDDDEADFIEAFWIDEDVSFSFHAYNFDLQTDSKGNFYFAKTGQHTSHHRPGSIMRVPPEGGRADAVAWGIRTPNGMGKLDDDRLTVSDNQGPWMPAGKVSVIEPGSFLGNMPTNPEQDKWLKAKHAGKLPTTFDEPMIWLPQELDNSCGGQVWVSDRRFGPLAGHLIHSSFGKGWLYYLSLQEVQEKTQASIVALPHQWQAGVMRLRVDPADGQLYGVGLAGWQGPENGKDGCFQRLRYTGDPVRMIDRVRTTATGLELTFNFAIDPSTIESADAWQIEMWDYLWSAKYGSDQYSVLKPGEKGRDLLSVQEVTMQDEHTLGLTIPDLHTCDQLSVKLKLRDAEGALFVEQVYLTIHTIPN